MALRISLAAALALLASCGGGGPTGTPVSPVSVATPKDQLKLSRFADCGEYRSYYADALTREFLSGFWGGIPCWSCPQPLAGVGAPSAAAEGHGPGPVVSPGPAPAPAAFSATNTQEEGVDEADLIEADPASGRIYAIPGYGEILTLQAIPPEQSRLMSRTPLAGPYSSGLYLDSASARLVAVGGGYGGFAGPATPVQAYGGAELTFFDLSDPDHPLAVDRYEIAGQPIDSRRIGHRIHLVSNFPLWAPKALAEDASFFDLLYNQYLPALQRQDQPEIDRLAGEIRARVNSAVGGADLAEMLPSWRRGLDPNAPQQVMACTDVLRPGLDERLGLLVISSIDTDGGNLAQVGAINNAWQVYASPDHLYLAQTSGGWWFDPKQTQQTALYRFALSASGPAQPAGQGLVDGWLINSHSLSEFGGFLRAATSEARLEPDQQWSQTNHLFVLGPDDHGDLAVTGAVRDFVRGEQIYAARFLGARGFVVTFHQVDPLFAFDLSDPHAPRLAGELKVPGVSTYLHPYGSDRLVTIGREADTDGRMTGNLQLQMFDVADLAHPAVVDQAVLGGIDSYAWSVAEYDPHAFTLAGDLLSLPVQIGAADPAEAFSGFVAYHLTQSGFSEIARIDHKEVQDGSGSGCPAPPTAEGGATGSGGGTVPPADGGTDPAPCENFAPVRFNQPLRSVVLDEGPRTVLFTLSDAFLKAHDVSVTPASEVVSVPLRAE